MDLGWQGDEEQPINRATGFRVLGVVVVSTPSCGRIQYELLGTSDDLTTNASDRLITPCKHVAGEDVSAVIVL